jgi:iron complex outermembrane recepter protein
MPPANRLLTTLLVASGINVVQAADALDFQSASSGSEAAYFEAMPVVLTPSRLPQWLPDAPAAVTVIDRAEIRASGVRDLARLFRSVPGMQVGQERSSSYWVTYHGLGNDYPAEMQVLIDGRSVYSPGAFGGVDWLALPLDIDDIERIEIVRGTNSAAYGSNALLGVVNIITRESGEQSADRLRIRAGSAGVADLAGSRYRATESGGWALSASHEQDCGFSGLNDDRRVDKASLRVDHRLSETQEFTLRLAASLSLRGAGYPDSLLDNNAERDWRQDAAAIDGKWRAQTSDAGEWQLQFYRNYERIRDAWSATAPGGYGVPLDRNRRALRDDVELQQRSSPTTSLGVVWGIGLRHDAVYSPFLYAMQADQAQTMRRAFANGDWHFAPRWSLNLGALAERYSHEDTRWSPRAHLNLQLGPHDTLRVGAARAWRQRNLFELYGHIRVIDPTNGQLLVEPFVPNPDLRSTRVDSGEVSYLGRFPSWNGQLDIRLFNERISDFVVREVVPAPGLLLPSSRYVNLSEAITLRGIEYELRSRPAVFRDATELRFTHTMIDRRTTSDAQTRRTAPYTAALTWQQTWTDQWSSRLTAYRMGPLAGGDGFVPGFDYEAPAYTAADVNLVYWTAWDKHRLQWMLSALNIGPRHQEIPDRSEQALHPDSPVNPVDRMVYLTLSLDLF